MVSEWRVKYFTLGVYNAFMFKMARQKYKINKWVVS